MSGTTVSVAVAAGLASAAVWGYCLFHPCFRVRDAAKRSLRLAIPLTLFLSVIAGRYRARVIHGTGASDVVGVAFLTAGIANGAWAIVTTTAAC